VSNGKGSRYRPANGARLRSEWDRIFRPMPPTMTWRVWCDDCQAQTTHSGDLSSCYGCEARAAERDPA
jgi:hypothetical protein